jgi:hypothetical protein
MKQRARGSTSSPDHRGGSDVEPRPGPPTGAGQAGAEDHLAYLADLALELHHMACEVPGAQTLAGLLKLAREEALLQAARRRAGS